MSLKDISSKTKLNKATLHEHLSKLYEAGLVKKKEREGHKWVYYKLTWKGECLLHPENTRIVVLFSFTFITLFVGIVNLVNYIKGVVIGKIVTVSGSTEILKRTNTGLIPGNSYKYDYLNKINATDGNILNKAAEEIFGDSAQANNLALEPLRNGVDGASKSIIDKGSTYEGLHDIIADGVDKTNSGSNISSSNLLIWHDPNMQIIAIVCIVAFSILLSIGIWRFYKNKKTNL